MEKNEPKAKEEPKVEEKKSPAVGTCGFENKQYFGKSGKKMTCMLPKNHGGDHSAPYPEEGADPKVLASFSNAADTPPDPSTLAKLNAAKEKKEAEDKAAAK